MTTSSPMTQATRMAGSRARGNKALFFRTGGHPCGVSIAKVVRILKYQELTPLPSSAAYVMGMLNLQGRILPVIDLALRLAKRAFVQNENACIVILQAEREGKTMTFGVAVEEVLGVTDILPEAIQAPPAGFDGVDLALVRGITGASRDMRLMLEVDAICPPTENEHSAAKAEAKA
jgi:purine-binding chemotaxis protein CheW